MLQSLNIGRNALVVNQAVMSVISNNIANMNTIGYSKQRVNLQALYSNATTGNPYQQAASVYGVDIESISRYRDSFIDSYYRDALSSKNYFDTIAQNASLLENLTNEFSNTGLGSYINSFFTAANNLSLYPTDATMKTNFAQEASNLALELNNISSQLIQTRATFVGDINNPSTLKSSFANVYCNEVNQLLQDIAKLNQDVIYQNNIGVENASGLLDERDILIDKLAEYIPITVEETQSGGTNISLGHYQLISGVKVNATFKANLGDENNPARISLENENAYEYISDAKDLIGKSGKLGAVLTLGGDSTSDVTIKSMMDNLDLIAQNLALEINALQNKFEAGPPQMHSAYYNPQSQKLEIGSEYSSSENPNIFISSGEAASTKITAATIKVNQEILDNPYKIATAYVETVDGVIKKPDEIGNNLTAKAFSDLREQSISGLKNLTFESFNTTITSDFGSKLNSAKINLETQENIYNSAYEKRESVIGVNMEEELMDLVKFQRAYEASARIFSTSSEILQTLVNLGR